VLFGVLKHYSLAVRLFGPNTNIRGQFQLSDILKKWVVSVLSEYSISEEMIVRATSDSGSDVKRCLKVCFLDLSWELCYPHMANCAMVEASGTTEDPQKSQNRLFRELNQAAKKVCGVFIKSDAAEYALGECLEECNLNPTAKVLSWKHHRWCSFIRCLGRLLYLWPALVRYFSRKQLAFTLIGKRDQLIQCYSILMHVKEAMVVCQADSVSVQGYMSFLELVAMALSKNPLEIVDTFDLGGGPVQNPAAPTTIPHESLSPVAKDLREKLILSMYKRYYCRYDPNERTEVESEKWSFHFDTVGLLYPPNNNGKLVAEYVRLVSEMMDRSHSQATIDDHVDAILELCWKRIRRLCIKYHTLKKELDAHEDIGESASMVSEQQSQSSSSNDRDGSIRISINYPPTKRLRLRLDNQQAEASEVVSPLESNHLTVDQVVDAEIRSYQSLKFDFSDVNPESILSWWQRSSGFPILSIVAGALLGQQASAGGMERDFIPASNELTGLRSTLSPANVEMTLCYHLNFDLIPDFVPRLKVEQIKTVIPKVSCGLELDSFTFSVSSDEEE